MRPRRFEPTGIVLSDADLEVAAKACVTGGLSYNGQRCTAVKLIMVHDSVAEAFLSKLLARVDALRVGLPFEEGVNITPLPEPNKPKILAELQAAQVRPAHPPKPPQATSLSSLPASAPSKALLCGGRARAAAPRRCAALWEGRWGPWRQLTSLLT